MMPPVDDMRPCRWCRETKPADHDCAGGPDPETDTQIFPAIRLAPDVKRLFREAVAAEIVRVRTVADAAIAHLVAELERVEQAVPDPAPIRIGRPPYSTTPDTTTSEGGATP